MMMIEIIGVTVAILGLASVLLWITARYEQHLGWFPQDGSAREPALRLLEARLHEDLEEGPKSLTGTDGPHPVPVLNPARPGLVRPARAGGQGLGPSTAPPFFDPGCGVEELRVEGFWEGGDLEPDRLEGGNRPERAGPGEPRSGGILSGPQPADTGRSFPDHDDVAAAYVPAPASEGMSVFHREHRRRKRPFRVDSRR